MSEPIVIRTSDRGMFKRCRTMWDFTSKIRQNYEPVQRYHAFDFGTAIHAGLQAYYEPKTWGEKKLMQQNARDAFYASFAELQKLVKIGDIAFELTFKESIDLGLGMLEFYFIWAPKQDVNIKPLYTEIEFEVPIPGLEGLAVYQGRIDLIVEVYDDDGNFLGYYIVDHKAQPLDELVLTPWGWRRMGDIQVGAMVVGSNGKPTAVTGIFPQGTLPCYVVTLSDGAQVRCSGDHLWETAKGVVTTMQLVCRDPKTKWGYTSGSVITPVAPIEFEDQELPVHPYILGLWLAEGRFDNSMVVISNKLGDTIKLAEQYLPTAHHFKKNSTKNHNWTLTGPKKIHNFAPETNLVRQGLRQLGFDKNTSSITKFIPQVYLQGSVEQRLLLLQGLMDGDGTVPDRTYARFTSMSPQLHEGVRALVHSLGGVARPTSWTPAPNGKPSGRQNFRFLNGMNPFQLVYKRDAYAHAETLVREVISIEEVEPTEMQCISVEAFDGLYVTTDYVLTHNTAKQFGQIMWLNLDDQCSSYAWAIKQMLGLDVRGVIYNQLRKSPPHPPKQLKNGGFSVAKNQDTSFEVYLRTLREHNIDPHYYREFLLFLKRNPKEYARRTTVMYNDDMMQVVQNRIYLEAQEMMNPDLRIYPSPSPMNCNGCRFFGPCLQTQEGREPFMDMYEKRPASKKEKRTTESEIYDG